MMMLMLLLSLTELVGLNLLLDICPQKKNKKCPSKAFRFFFFLFLFFPATIFSLQILQQQKIGNKQTPS